MFRFASLWIVAVLCSLACSAEVPNDPLKALEKKLHGHWYGQGPCDGELILHGDGRFERKFFGPAGDHFKGTWKCEWNALPPSLKLLEADPADDVEAETEWKVWELNEKNLVIQFVTRPPHGEATSSEYRREKKKP